MSNRRYYQFMYTPHVKPVILDCAFTVNAADSGGFGVTGVSGTGIKNVYMHTSSTPATGNPNPANGVIIITLRDNYSAFLGMDWSVEAPLTGTPSSSTTANTSYAITALGTATTAQWQAVGLPVGVTPAVGAAFTATASASIGGSATVDSIKTSGAGFDHIEVLGNPSKTIAPVGNGAAPGQILMECFKEHVLAAPVDTSVILVRLYFSDSSLSTGY